MASDAFFRMGSTHAICQDYAIAGAHRRVSGDRKSHYAILSDGCSGISDPREPGSPYTDYGSRILVQLFKHQLNLQIGISEQTLIREAREIVDILRLPVTALDATLLAVAQDVEHNKINVYQSGDGVVAFRHRESKEIHYRQIRFGNNMPFYLRYLLSYRDLKQYHELAGTISITTNIRSPDGTWRGEKTIESPLVTEDHDQRCLTHDCDHDLVLLMSDGVESFVQTSNGQSVSVPDILDQLFAFKGFEGQFITRRCTRFLKLCAEKGWIHTDDFSVAGIHVPPTARNSEERSDVLL